VAADLKTFEALGVWGTCAVVAVTAQNTLGVTGVETVAPSLVAGQIEAVTSDLGVDAAKTGMLATAAHVSAVVDALDRHDVGPLVVDPVAVATTGHRLLDEDAVGVLAARLLPRAAVVTPNTAEAALLAGMDEVTSPDAARRAADAIRARGAGAVLVTGGHLPGPAADLLVTDQGEVWLEGDRLDARGAHGGGCSLSAAIAALLARGLPIERACREAKEHVAGAIRHAPALGAGARPVDPGWRSRLDPPRRLPRPGLDPHPLGDELVGVRPTDRHRDFVVAMWADERVTSMLGGTRDRDAALAMLAGMVGHWERHGWGPWIVESRGRPRGWGGINQATFAGRAVVEIGYAVHPDEWGRGLATSTARAAMRVAFDLLGFDEVVAFTLPHNEASRRVMEKAGLEHAGEATYKGWNHVWYRRQAGDRAQAEG